MGDGSGKAGEGRGPPWIFIHGTDIVKKLNSAIIGLFFAIFWSFFVAPPPGNFSADALDSSCSFRHKVLLC